MKQLTKEQQEQALMLIENLSNETMQINAPFAYYIESAKAFLQSLKPKIYVCINNCGTIVFYSKSVLNEAFVFHEKEAHRFESIEQAQIFIDEYLEKNYPMYVVIA